MKRLQKNLKNGKAKLIKTRKAFKKAATDMKDRLMNMEDNVMTYAKHHPFKMVGISLVAGAVIARIVRMFR